MHKASVFTKRLLVICPVLISLVGCASSVLAPVVAAAPTVNANRNYYRVNKGDTLYSIAWAYGLDYRALAAANHLLINYQITSGQVLTLKVSKRLPKPYHAKVRAKKYQPPVFAADSYQRVNSWQWPVRGRIVERFAKNHNQGIDIAGQLDSPVRASASGRVVYAGDGVRGYGNLIIIKHNANYLSAYAYNRRLVVTLGQYVKTGQTIAMLGRDLAGRPLLHFEIRRNGQAVNPLQYLH